MSADLLMQFERLLTLPDPDLQEMIVGTGVAPPPEFAELIAAVRAFHGLTTE
jgi:succinate dehydrogenase flavin-adding protein (antitoxin of CptAB toxin-antitoxin module)